MSAERLCLQSHGQMLAVDLHSWRVRCASAGAACALGLPRQPLAGAALPELLGPELLHLWLESLAWGGTQAAPQRLLGQRVDPRGRLHDVVVQSCGDLLLVELLPRRRAGLGADDTPWLEQLAQRLAAAGEDRRRLPLLADEVRLPAQHCERQVWLPDARGRLMSPRWVAASQPARQANGPACDAEGRRRHGGRALQVRVLVDLKDDGRPLEGEIGALADYQDRMHLARAQPEERRLLEALGARSGLLAMRWQGERLACLLVASSPDAVNPGLEAVAGIERLLLVEALVQRAMAAR